MGVRRGFLAAAVAGVLALTACGGADTGTGSADAAGEGGVHGTPVDLTFTVPTIDGGTFDGTSLADQPAVLWFWAPWCTTCRAEAPEVSALADDYDGQVTVVGVAGLDDSVEAMQQFVDQTGVGNIPHLADRDGVVWQRFEIQAQSTFVILDEHSGIVRRGLMSPDEVADRLDRLVG